MQQRHLIHPIFRFFIYPHGDAFHMTHHLLPAVPHYHLDFAHQMLMNWNPYAKAHHCYGYFNTGLTHLPSTFSEMIEKSQSNESNPVLTDRD
jgi:fatty acid desaturase